MSPVAVSIFIPEQRGETVNGRAVRGAIFGVMAARATARWLERQTLAVCDISCARAHFSATVEKLGPIGSPFQ